MMNVKQALLAVAIALVPVTGCMGGAYVEPGGEVEMDTAPPPPVDEPVPVLAAGSIWVPGYWHADGGRWSWVHGHTEDARQGRWVAPRSERRGQRYVYHRGHWEH